MPAAVNGCKRTIDCAGHVGDNVVRFRAQKERLLARRLENVFGVKPLERLEQDLERRVLQSAIQDSGINPAKNFLDHKEDYDSSELLALMQRMPKGAVLHVHGIAAADFTTVVDIIRKSPQCFVWLGSSDATQDKTAPPIRGSIGIFEGPDHAGTGWVSASTCDRSELYSFLTLPRGLSSEEQCWAEFGALWHRIAAVSACAPLYFGRGGLLWDILVRQTAANVMYLEIKEPLFMPFKDYDGRVLSDSEFVSAFRDTVDQFCSEHPDFIGARVVLTCLKRQSGDELRDCYRRAALLKEQFPDFVAGFDTAGPEDLMPPIEEFASTLDEERKAAASRGIDLPLLLHAGETTAPTATQVVDAVALGCERIGHGFALARHPSIIPEVIARGISLECCPISNQVLGYFPNLATHPSLTLFRSGVPMHLSPDDPGMWHYSDVSYDFAAVAKAWNLGLAELKALARNSLAFSSLRGASREEVLQQWENRWVQWVQSEIIRAG